MPEYGDRLEKARTGMPLCEACGTPQVQVTNYWDSPMKWRCRRCAHRFSYEPSTQSGQHPTQKR